MKKNIILSSLLFLGIAFSCNEDVLEQSNPNGVTVDNYYKNGAELTSGVTSVYSMLKSNNLVAREWFFLHDMRSDDVSAGGGQLETPRNQLLLGTHDSGNSVLGTVWLAYYRLIHRANSVVDNSSEVADIVAADKARLLAEARFLRAYAYYELVSMWGGVPLYKNYVLTLDGNLPRSTDAEVYAYIIAELKEIQEQLPAAYDAGNQGRVTKGAAQMLLARVFLQQGNYADAKTELLKVYNSNVYALVDNYNDNFLEETEFNKESIFEVNFYPSGGVYNWDGDGNGATAGTETVRTQEYSAIGWRNAIPSNSLLNDFEKTTKGDTKTDPRYDDSFYFTGEKYNKGASTLTDGQQNGNASVVDGVTQKVSWQKYSLMYKMNESFLTGGINQRIMRFAETILSLAEAENELGNIPQAVKYLNMVRARKSVSMPPYPTAKYPVTTKDQVFAAIMHERRVEHSGEQIRNRDLLRWRKNGKLKAEPLAYFQANRHELLPIPQQEVDNNAKIEATDQNPGY
ncbi:RagB/SusD family nutrient uptake outer membrane protein [Dyadobacter sediminis]|uniref:RagB/SusD family nutrient uptake outer membrane protein n=1 Tax=Dyadobacter sediminis TaxID=1493691 RepID=A0A5R9KHZ5_9BACT|nr:RagB/SusD family nutrient uptake outer membrane protein [Dyadobacter sediminis]TLU95850.1 RagB/SusD family nutrient uptake outer membrane protein [Dyadobacter sediminis]GGB77074.1 membrane protein [Dyadobacter sediminis]